MHRSPFANGDGIFYTSYFVCKITFPDESPSAISW